jgi:hypothetical protein
LSAPPLYVLLGYEVVLLLKQAYRRDEDARALSWHRTPRTAEGGCWPSVGDLLVCNGANPIHAHARASILLT